MAAGLRNTTDWDTPTPRHVSTDAPTGDGRTTTAVALEHFVAAPAAVLHRVISEPELVRQWTMWRPESRVCDGELVDATSSRGRTHTHRLVRVRDEADGVRWRESWNDRPGGWFDVQLEPLDNGTRVLLTRGIRTFGHLAPLLRWPARVLTGLGLPTAVQNVSFACADLMDESDR